MKEINEQEAYLNKFSISNSAIQDWRKMAPQRWFDTWVSKTIKRPSRPATTMGSLLDCIIFTPKDYDKRFLEAEIEMPSPKVKLILDQIFEYITELNKKAVDLKIPLIPVNLEDKELVISFCKANEHYVSKPDQAYNDVLKKDNGYFAFLAKANGRLVISKQEKQTAEELKKILYTNPVSKPFLEPKKNCEVVFQVRIFSEYDVSGFENLDFLPVKGAVDIIHFNHKTKTVREVDLKLTADAFLFEEAVKRFGYIQQHSFYDFLIHKWLETYLGGKYKDYHVANPLNLVMDDDLRVPYIYAYNANDLHILRKGIENTKIIGWEDILNEIAFHMNKQDWSRPRQHILNGFINVQAFTKR